MSDAYMFLHRAGSVRDVNLQSRSWQTNPETKTFRKPPPSCTRVHVSLLKPRIAGLSLPLDTSLQLPNIVMFRPSKIAFVTVGATAPFNALIAACLSSTVIAALGTQGYTDLRVQYGEGRSVFEQWLATTVGSRHSVSVSGFDFADSLREEIAAADLVISHAGMCSETFYARAAELIVR